MELVPVSEPVPTFSGGYIILIVIIIVLLIVVVIVIAYFATRKTTTITPVITEIGDLGGVEELVEDEDVEMSDVIDTEFPMFNELGSTAGQSRFSLYVVPAIQPNSTRESRKYGGFHSTQYPSQYMPSNYSIVNAMQGFSMQNQQWNLTLPGISTKVKKVTSKNLLLMMINGASTLDALKKYLGTPAGGNWKRPWGAQHLTLGQLNPLDVAKPSDFTSQTTWFVQLVRSPGHRWETADRVILRIATGHHN